MDRGPICDRGEAFWRRFCLLPMSFFLSNSSQISTIIPVPSRSDDHHLSLTFGLTAHFSQCMWLAKGSSRSKWGLG